MIESEPVINIPAREGMSKVQGIKLFFKCAGVVIGAVGSLGSVAYGLESILSKPAVVEKIEPNLEQKNKAKEDLGSKTIYISTLGKEFPPLF